MTLRENDPRNVMNDLSRGNRVLVVAGEASVRAFIQRTLESVLLEVETASRFENAILKLRSGDFRVLVLDPTIPAVDGLDLLRELGREDRSLTRRTIVVVERESPMIEHLEAFPFCRRIERPVVRQQLILAVSECLRESSD